LGPMEHSKNRSARKYTLKTAHVALTPATAVDLCSALREEIWHSWASGNSAPPPALYVQDGLIVMESKGARHSLWIVDSTEERVRAHWDGFRGPLAALTPAELEVALLVDKNARHAARARVARLAKMGGM
jgi:hypothetical protein